MQLTRLGINNLRSIAEASIDLSPGINLFYGENGSGKTSILEACALLSRGRSFNATKNQELIAFGSEQLTSTLSFTNHLQRQAGFSLSLQGERSLRLDGNNQPSMQQLAKSLPLLFVTPRSFQLLEGSSKERRGFVDWLAFHAEPEFAIVHARLKRLLAQRNALLKDPQTDMGTWDKHFIEACKQINTHRENLLIRLRPLLQQNLEFWLEKKSIDFLSHPGWSSNSSLEEQLCRNLERDRKNGFTLKGAHRYDLHFLFSGHEAAKVLSRGEKKRLVLALVFSQLQLAQQLGIEPVLLVDDLTAELDEKGCLRALELAQKQSDQLLVTCIGKGQLEQMAARVFHVKQGEVLEQ